MRINHDILQTLQGIKKPAEEFGFKGSITITQEGEAGCGSKEIADIKQKPGKLSKENEILKELVLSQKKIIEMLEGKAGK